MLPVIFSLLLFSPVVSSESCDPEPKVLTNLWRITGDPPSYFFGTIHLPYTRVWPGVSEQVKSALLSADQVYWEVDPASEELKNCQLLPDNKKLDEVLSPELMRRLRDHMDWLRSEMPSWLTLEQKNVGINFDVLTENWERKRPQWLR